MLKYKRTDVVVYFSFKELEYRRVDGCWEVLFDGMWIQSKDCQVIEEQYKKRTALRNLIKKRDELNKSSLLYTDGDKNNELSQIVSEIINMIGITQYIDSTSQMLFDKLDSGEIDIK